MHTVSVLVAERGADWLGWARLLRRGAGDTIVLAQPALEDDAAFARRVADRIERLELEGAPVLQAAFIGGDRDDAEAAEARVQRSAILRRLAALLANSGRAAKLYVDAAARGGRASQRLMKALAWAVADLAKGSRLKVLAGGGRDSGEGETDPT